MILSLIKEQHFLGESAHIYFQLTCHHRRRSLAGPIIVDESEPSSFVIHQSKTNKGAKGRSVMDVRIESARAATVHAFALPFMVVSGL